MIKPIKSIIRQMGLRLTQQHLSEATATIAKHKKRKHHFNAVDAPNGQDKNSTESE